jgi:hypothetical protein
VDETTVSPQGHGNTGGAQLKRVLLPLIAQRIKARGRDVDRGDTSEIFRTQRRAAWVNGRALLG